MGSHQTIFEGFLISYLSARSKLVNLSLRKNLTSNGYKPIGVLTHTKSSYSDDRLPIGYLLPDFQPHRSNFLNRFTSVHFTSLQFNQAGRGSTEKKNRSHRTVRLIRIICIDQATCYLIPSQFRSSFDPLSQRRKNRSKMNFKPLYAHRSFDPPKFPRYQRIILEAL